MDYVPGFLYYIGDIMAGNTRGKIKECFEGMHRNFDWQEAHCDKIVRLIDGRNKPLTEAITALHAQIKTLDDLTQGLYSTI